MAVALVCSKEDVILLLVKVHYGPIMYDEFHWCSSHYAVYARTKKNSNTQGSSPNVVKVISIPQGTARKGKNSLPLERILFFKRSSNLKRDIIVGNHYLIQQSPFDVRNFNSVLATALVLFGLVCLLLCVCLSVSGVRVL